MQRSVQRRFLGLRYWRRVHARIGTQLFPPDFSRVDAEMVTSRVLMLECVSLNATPFEFGTERTRTEPHEKTLEEAARRDLRKAAAR